MKEIARFYEPEEAEIAAGYLRAQGFDVELADKGMLGVEPHLRIALGGYRLMAPEKQAYQAKLLLEEVRGAPEKRSYVSGQVCKRCGSPALKRIRGLWLPGFLFFLGGFAAAPATKNLRCTACSHKQRAEPDEEDQ